ncbi:MAG: GNAT family N-acetyltransferase, partial [Candidatus Omnitrophica bacterium]|nr:GNAT family N-acetyltransferase [Candidatus Omnitrophota bacterium]
MILTSQWGTHLDRLGFGQDIYFSESYLRLAAGLGETPECFVYEEKDEFFLFPYIKKPVSILDQEAYDFESAYGYGGPLTNSMDRGFISRAVQEMFIEMRRSKLIAGFIRFHPLLANEEIFAGQKDIHVLFDRKTVFMDLSVGQEVLWKEHLHPKHRNAIREAENSGLLFEIDEELRLLDQFKMLYFETMDRVGADRYYFFDDRYFDALKSLGKNVFIA